jgi:hypothetical protein
MCKFLPKKKIGNLGLISGIFLIFSGLVCLILCIIQYNIINFQYSKANEFSRISELFLGANTILLFSCLFSIVLFLGFMQCKTMQLIFLIFQSIFTLFIFISGIIIIVSGNISKNQLTKTCQKDLKGIFKHFLLLDDYFKLIDNYLCSDECPCYFNKNSTYEKFKNPQLNNVSSELIDSINFNKNVNLIDNNYYYEFNFNNCSEKVKEKAFIKFILHSEENRKYFENINHEKFFKFWRKIENKFKCSGWCNTPYINHDINLDELEKNDEKNNENERFIIKFLFSNINKGIVPNIGCMNKLTDWLPKYIYAFGSLLIISSIVIGITVVFDFSLYLDLTKEGPIIHEQDTLDESTDQKGYIKKNGNEIVVIIKGEKNNFIHNNIEEKNNDIN